MPPRRDRRISSYLRHEVAAYSPYWRTSLAVDLDRIPARPFDFIAAAGPGLVLRPDVPSVYHFGARRLALRTAWSRLWGRQRVVNDKVLVPRYKPVLWTLDFGLPIAYSEADVDRLARIGARWLTDAGVEADDVVATMLPAAPPNLDWWQTVAGCRQARLSAIHLGIGAQAKDLDRLRPTVVIGRPMPLLRVLREAAAAGTNAPRLVIAVGRPLDDGLRAHISAAAQGAPVLNAWAPPGVRALWAECRGGAAQGLHTWPASEVVELIDPLTANPAPAGAGGEVAWSPLGWRGTVMLRLRTGVFATVDDSVCPACFRHAPRLSVSGGTPHFFAVLDRHPDVTAWQAELRAVNGSEELVVFLSTDRQDRLEPMLRELDDFLSVTQFVVLAQDELDARVARHDDSRVVDLRPS